MNDQPSLFDDPRDRPPVWVTDQPEGSLPQRWWTFHAEHPEVAASLARLARRLLRRGYQHLGIGMLWETTRYRTMLGAGPGEDIYRLNNNHRAYYARWLMERHSDLAGVFETRSSEAER